MIYWAKRGRLWLNLPLVSLLYDALGRHLHCIETRFGRIDLITVLPAHTATKGWDHMKYLHDCLTAWPQTNWDLDVLIKAKPSNAEERRGEIDPALFQVQQTCDLRNRRVLLVDDTWTSGGSITPQPRLSSMPAGCHQSPCRLGRQFRPNPPGGDTEFQESLSYGTLDDLDNCAVHPAELADW